MSGIRPDASLQEAVLGSTIASHPPAYYTVILPPQIIVAFNDHTDVQTAWGREGIARLGYHVSLAPITRNDARHLEHTHDTDPSLGLRPSGVRRVRPAPLARAALVVQPLRQVRVQPLLGNVRLPPGGLRRAREVRARVRPSERRRWRVDDMWGTRSCFRPDDHTAACWVGGGRAQFGEHPGCV